MKTKETQAEKLAKVDRLIEYYSTKEGPGLPSILDALYTRRYNLARPSFAERICELFCRLTRGAA